MVNCTIGRHNTHSHKVKPYNETILPACLRDLIMILNQTTENWPNQCVQWHSSFQFYSIIFLGCLGSMRHGYFVDYDNDLFSFSLYLQWIRVYWSTRNDLFVSRRTIPICFLSASIILRKFIPLFGFDSLKIDHHDRIMFGDKKSRIDIIMGQIALCVLPLRQDKLIYLWLDGPDNNTVLFMVFNLFRLKIKQIKHNSIR